MTSLIPAVHFVVLSLLPQHPVSMHGSAARRGERLVAEASGKAPDLAAMKVPFRFNDDSLDVSYRDALAAAARCLKSQEGVTLDVQGHADERGTSEYNLALGERRGITVRNYLEGLGVPRSRMTVNSFGEERPAVQGHDEAAWAANRRVEFKTKGTFAAGKTGCADEDTVAQTDTKRVDDDEEARRRAQEEEAARRRRQQEEDEARRRAAEQAKPRPAAVSTRMFPWLPIWVGPVVMAVSVLPMLTSLPFLASVVYLGPQVWTAPNTCREPLIIQNGSPTTDIPAAHPGNLCGTGWSAGLHDVNRPISVPGAAVGVGGFLLFAGGALVTFGVGVVLLVMALIPASQSEPPPPAP